MVPTDAQLHDAAWTLFALCLYFLPTIIYVIRWRADTYSLRNLPTALICFALNLILGWTLIVWIVCLVWGLGLSENEFVF